MTMTHKETNRGKEDEASEASTAEENIINQELDHSLRRAFLWVDGLSVFGFHERNDWAEIGFIEPEHSLVEMRIYRQPGCHLVWSTGRDFPHSTKDIIITVNSTRPSELGSFFCDGHEPPQHREDFCHMPNVAKWFNRVKLPYGPFAGGHLSARVRVHDGRFYTLKKSVSDVVIKKDGAVYYQGKLGRVLGADIVCGPTEILNVKIDAVRGVSPEVNIPLADSDEYKYEIMVRTKPTTWNNHFHHIFSVLAKPLTITSRFDLRFDPPEPEIFACDDPRAPEPAIEIKSIEYICETVTGGGG